MADYTFTRINRIPRKRRPESRVTLLVAMLTLWFLVYVAV